MFTSGLSASEFALMGQLGPRPVAQVMGASVIRIGWQYLPALTPGEAFVSTGWGYSTGYPSATGYGLTNRLTEPSFPQVRSYVWRTPVVCELDVHADAWNAARRQAVDRLAEEALEAGADAVVGVRVERDDHRFGGGLIEYVVTGTAVRLPGSRLEDWPVLTHLSGQDYWRLHSSGYDPAGFLGATAVVFASPPRATRLRRARTTARNQELDELSHGFHLARESVRRRLRDQVTDARAWGAVGVAFEHAVHRETFHLASSIQTADRRGWHRGRMGVPYYVSGHADTERKGWVITMHATGTAHRPSDLATGPAGQARHPDERVMTDSDPTSSYDPTSIEGIPESGLERLEQNRAGLFTSDLSVNEFLLVTQAGFDPVGLVVGSSIFHIGFQVAGPTTSRELDVLSQAMYSARHLAMTRMEEEADQLGADGIVGVRLEVGRYDWGPNMAEFIAIGTAVKHREGVLHRAPNGRPFQSDLSGQEFWTLLRTGHRPVGMVMGSCVYHVGRRGPLKTIAQTGRNVEMPNFTQALYDARELAMQRMQSEAQELGAEGIVGVTLTEKSHGWGSHVIEFFALGTAIVPMEAAVSIEPPITVLDLSDR